MKSRTWLLRRKLHLLGACCLGALALCGIARLAIGALGAPGEEALTSAAAVRIAVVDIARVLSRCEEYRDYQESRKLKVDKMNRTLRKLDTGVRFLRSEYENLAPGTQAAADKRKQIEEALMEYRNTETQFQREIAAEHNRFLHRLFVKVSEVVEQYATRNGVDLVLKKRGLEAASQQELQMELLIATTNVLYSGERFDVTEDIIELLNAGYPAEIEVK